MADKPKTVSIEVPEHLAASMKALLDHVEAVRARAHEPDVRFAEAEARLGELTADIEAASLSSFLGALDPSDERVEVAGVSYRRLHQPSAESYLSLRGTVRVNRALYRQEGVRNGPTVVPMELRAGIVEGRYTPAAARLAGVLAQEMPSRSTELVCRTAGVLGHGRASQFRVGVDLGQRWEEIHEAAETALIEQMEIPACVVSASVAVDRVSLAMAEPRPVTKADVAAGIKRPVAVNFRMAFSAALTLYDAEGKPLSTIRYAHVPEGGSVAVETSLRRDIEVLARRVPGLRIVTLGDGAAEIQNILDRVTIGVTVAARLVDFWHLAEHLGEALAAMGWYVADQLGDWKSLLYDRDDAIDTIEHDLRRWSDGYAPEAVPEGLHAALTYVENHRDRLRYATARAAHLPVGSGTVEATGKTIVEVRMKRPGARWQPVGAQAIMGLRALATSSTERWDLAMAQILQTYTAPVKALPPRRKVRRPNRR
jgi:hypothetical protein